MKCSNCNKEMIDKGYHKVLDTHMIQRVWECKPCNNVHHEAPINNE